MDEQVNQQQSISPEQPDQTSGEHHGKKKVLIIALVVWFVVAGAAGVAYFYWDKISELIPFLNKEAEPVTCSLEAKICPDGSSVSRVSPNCEFAQCPEAKCAKEGEEISTMPLTDPTAERYDCCEGLTAVGLGNPSETEEGICDIIADVSVCVYCGNGECGLGENKCNCPEDCEDEASNLLSIDVSTDTDNDGLSDYEETEIYMTNINNIDSDGDGYSDGDEVRNGYNPNGEGRLIEISNTIEGLLYKHEIAYSKCQAGELKSEYYFSDNYEEILSSIISNEDKTDYEIKDTFIDSLFAGKIYINEIERIEILERVFSDKNELVVKYRVHYLNDDNGARPFPVDNYKALIKINGKWLFKAESIMDNEIIKEGLQSKARDAKRAADIKEIQTALDLYYQDAGEYPELINVGSSIEFDGNNYMQIVPYNPKPGDGACPENFEYQYSANNDRSTYKLIFCISTNFGEYAAGINVVEPISIKNLSAEIKPSYKKCLSTVELRDKDRIHNIKVLQTGLELYFNDAGSYPDNIQPGYELKFNQMTYMNEIPMNPQPNVGICQEYPKYIYNQTNNGASYELIFCLEEGDEDYTAGVHKVIPFGIE